MNDQSELRPMPVWPAHRYLQRKRKTTEQTGNRRRLPIYPFGQERQVARFIGAPTGVTGSMVRAAVIASVLTMATVAAALAVAWFILF